MIKHIFISHSSKNADVANRILEYFEHTGLSCWIAPRNIPATARYPSAIVQGIENSRVFLLLLSPDSNSSDHVLSEVEIAFSKKLPIMAISIDEIRLDANLKYFLGTSQIKQVSNPPTDQELEYFYQIAQEKIKVGGDPPFQKEEKATVSNIIENSVYPLAISLNDIREQELNKSSTGMNRDGIDQSIFRFNLIFVKFIAFCLISALKDSTDSDIYDKAIKKMATMTEPKGVDWLDLIRMLSASSTLPLDAFPGLSDLLQFIKNKLNESEHLLSLWPDLVKQNNENQNQTDLPTILDFSHAIFAYSENYKARGERIEQSSSMIKNVFLDELSRSNFFDGLALAAVQSVRPNKEKRVFEHHFIYFTGLCPQSHEQPFLTKDWELIESSSVVLFRENDQQHYLNLSPYIIASKDFSDLLFWERSASFYTIIYSQLLDKSTKEVKADSTDPFISALQKANEYYLKRSTGSFKSSEDFTELYQSVSKEFDQKVKNPVCKNSVMSQLMILKEQVETAVEKDPHQDFTTWVTKLSRLKNNTLVGEFYQLAPTDIEFILTDKHHGRYIVGDKFLRERRNSDPNFKTIANLIGKPCSDEVVALLLLGFGEASRYPIHKFGVEHLFIALSKLCKKEIFEWYHALGVHPKHHRDAVRTVLAAISPKIEIPRKNHHITIKERLQLVFQMAVSEVNYGKRETISLMDLFSAILREGRSMPIRVLLEVYDLTNDKLLGEFYRILRTS